MERKQVTRVQTSHSLPARCFLARHMGLSLSFPWRSEHAAAVVHSPKSKLNTMCPVGIWSHGEASRDPALHSLSILLTRIRPHGPQPSWSQRLVRLSKPTSNKSQSPPAVRLCTAARGPLLWGPGTPHFLVTTKPVPHNSSLIQCILSTTEGSPRGHGWGAPLLGCRFCLPMLATVFCLPRTPNPRTFVVPTMCQGGNQDNSVHQAMAKNHPRTYSYGLVTSYFKEVT